MCEISDLMHSMTQRFIFDCICDKISLSTCLVVSVIFQYLEIGIIEDSFSWNRFAKRKGYLQKEG